MPQLDPAVFSSQLVWLAIFFVALYVLMARLALPRVEAVFARRNERIAGNLARAEALKSEAAAILAAYEKAIAEAKASAQAQASANAAEIARIVAAREGELGSALAAKTAAAEAAIASAKAKAMRDIEIVAGELAALMAKRVAGLEIPAGAAASAIAAQDRGA